MKISSVMECSLAKLEQQLKLAVLQPCACMMFAQISKKCEPKFQNFIFLFFFFLANIQTWFNASLKYCKTTAKVLNNIHCSTNVFGEATEITKIQNINYLKCLVSSLGLIKTFSKRGLKGLRGFLDLVIEA